MAEFSIETLLLSLEKGHSLEEALAETCDFPARMREPEIWDQVNTWIDTLTKDILEKAAPEKIPARMRDKIAFGVLTRLNIMEKYKRALQSLSTRTFRPSYQFTNLKSLWRSADLIWWWAGDQATDFNHYTKRGLLVMVLGSTYIYWLEQASTDWPKTEAFVGRMIDRVMKVSKITQPIKALWSRCQGASEGPK